MLARSASAPPRANWFNGGEVGPLVIPAAGVSFVTATSTAPSAFVGLADRASAVRWSFGHGLQPTRLEAHGTTRSAYDTRRWRRHGVAFKDMPRCLRHQRRRRRAFDYIRPTEQGRPPRDQSWRTPERRRTPLPGSGNARAARDDRFTARRPFGLRRATAGAGACGRPEADRRELFDHQHGRACSALPGPRRGRTTRSSSAGGLRRHRTGSIRSRSPASS